MALEIKEKDGILQILGNVSSQNVTLVKNHLGKLLEISEVLMVSLEKVSSLDAGAARTLEHLYREAAKNNKVLSLIGMENDQISEIMRTTKTHYILSPDRV